VTTLPRRSFLLASGLSVVTVACGNDRSTSESPPSESTAGAKPSYVLIASFPQGDPYATPGAPQRLPFLIAEGGDAPLDRIDGPLTFTVTKDQVAVGAPIQVEPRSTGLTRAYLPVEVTFTDVGIHDLHTTYRGAKLTASIEVFPPEQVILPQRGAPLPPVDTATTAATQGVDPICTNDPPCPLHSTSLSDSLRAGRPVALLLATPRFCQTAICGPVLDELLAAVRNRTDIDAIHVEPYANPLAVESIAQADLTSLTSAYQMSFEPCLFVTNSKGILVRRLDSIYDRTELNEALDAAVASE